MSGTRRTLAKSKIKSKNNHFGADARKCRYNIIFHQWQNNENYC
jgi:hypothetical protein